MCIYIYIYTMSTACQCGFSVLELLHLLHTQPKAWEVLVLLRHEALPVYMCIIQCNVEYSTE